MADSKLFMIPFGASGDRAAIPDTVDPSGAVSWPQGFGPDYERDPATDPMAKRVPRDETNEYLYQITNAIKFLQIYGAPEWYPDDGTGNPVSYPVGAKVRHLNQNWVSLVAANTAAPGASPSSWAKDDAFSLDALVATAAEARAAASNVKIMTPLQNKNSFEGNLASPGWQKLPSGLIMQFGMGSIPPSGGSHAGTNVYFPVPFSAHPFSVSVTANGTANSTLGFSPAGAAESISLTGFKAVTDTLDPSVAINKSVPFSWIAIGL